MLSFVIVPLHVVFYVLASFIIAVEFISVDELSLKDTVKSFDVCIFFRRCYVRKFLACRGRPAVGR